MQRCISSVWGFVHSCTSPRDWISNTREHVKRRRVPGPITPVYCVTQKLRYFIFNRILSERHKIYFLTSQRTQSFCIINTDLLIMFRKRFAFYSENHTKYMSKLFLSQYLTNLVHKMFYTISFISCLYMFRSQALIIRRSKLHYTASGIITPIGVMISERYWDKYTEMHGQQNAKKI